MSVNKRPAGVGHGDPLAVDLADELVVRVAGDHQVDRIVERGGDVGDRAGEPAAAILLAAIGESALVQQHDDGFDALVPADREPAR